MRAKLLVVRGQPQGKQLLFPCGEYVIGRGDECHIRPNSSWVSRQHCLLRVADDGVVLKDLGSTNGTLVNGTRVVGERELNDGDNVQIGPLVFRLGLNQRTDYRKRSQDETKSSIGCLETSEADALTAELPPENEHAPVITPTGQKRTAR
jgi:pSer/pThr/pTyr-binding forkhead associated (FHA) protein